MATESKDAPKSLIEKGKRLDGRKPEELRPFKFEAGVLEKADGSCYCEFGKTKVIAGCHGPRTIHPRHMMEYDRTVVRCKYDMAAFSTEDRNRPGPSRRSKEISLVLSKALSSVVQVKKFPRTAIDIFVEIIQADAGTRVTALNAASVALADAGIPMKDLVVANAFGKIYDKDKKGHVVVDLFKDEDNYGFADCAYAYSPVLERIILLQMDGHLTRDEWKKGWEMSQPAIKKIYNAQIEALKRRYE